MPGLVFFGRRWQVGSDDVYWMSFSSVFFNTLFLVLISVAFGVSSSAEECARRDTAYRLLHALYFGLTLAVYGLHTVLSAISIKVSLRGVRSQPGARGKTRRK